MTPGVLLVVQAMELAGLIVKRKNTRSWKSQCPFHEDNEPTLGLDVQDKDGVGRWVLYVSCQVCGNVNGDRLFEWLDLPRPWGRYYHQGNGALATSRPKYVEPISDEKVRQYVAYLHRRDDLLEYLTSKRQLSRHTITRFEIGYDEQRDKYVLPVRDEGRLVNLRRYLPDAPPGDKMRNASGHGSPARLYPSLPRSGAVVICEGEWDALLLWQHGLHAVTSTHGAGTFLDEWVPEFFWRDVAFVFDCDDRGRTAAEQHATKVASVARSVRVVDLGLGEKEDITDWFRQGRSASRLRRLINDTPEWSP